MRRRGLENPGDGDYLLLQGGASSYTYTAGSKQKVRIRININSYDISGICSRLGLFADLILV